MARVNANTGQQKFRTIDVCVTMWSEIIDGGLINII